MFKLAILGCENSHANGFLKAYSSKDDIEIAGVYLKRYPSGIGIRQRRDD